MTERKRREEKRREEKLRKGRGNVKRKIRGKKKK